MNKSFLIFSSLLFVTIVSGTIVISRLIEAKEPKNTPSPVVTAEASPTVTPSDFMQKPAVSVRRDDDGDDD